MTAALVGRPELLANSLKSNYYTYNYITNLNFHDLTVAALASTIYIYIYIYMAQSFLAKFAQPYLLQTYS